MICDLPGFCFAATFPLAPLECVLMHRQTASGHTARDFWDDGTNRVFFSLAEHANSEATWEYVLVFKNSAKIMHVLDEMLTSTTNGACLITKVVAAKTINAHTGDKILFLLVSASDQVIFQHAQKIGLMVSCRAVWPSPSTDADSANALSDEEERHTCIFCLQSSQGGRL